MHNISLTNCNNILQGNVTIKKNKLNIKYGINGTGKSTISKAILLSNSAEKLQSLKTYYTEDLANVSVSPAVSKVLVFDDTFVDQVVFKEENVIENTFEVFLKTPNYDEKKQALDNRLVALREIMEENHEISVLKENLSKINDKFKRNTNGGISKTGTYKSLLSKQNLYNVPTELESYKPFLENKDINIPWIDWKNKGETYDIGSHCPYCAELLDIPKHSAKRDVFKKTYSKSDSQNLKEALELLENLKQYMKEDKYVELIGFIKNDTPEDAISIIVGKLVSEIDLMLSRFQAIAEFGYKKIVITDIASIESHINKMDFPLPLFDMFGGEIINRVFTKINSNVSKLKEDVQELKRDLGALKGILKATIQSSQNDINGFLKTAGIHYELEIQAEDESNSKTILKQCFAAEKTGVSDIRQRLSWGEKNAFSLILFMYYAQAQNPDLIILDDPISSFDSNKKYAIMHRMFKNLGKKDVSFIGKTVLLLTHDFEPITDFILVGKLAEDKAMASYVWNDNGILREKEINALVDVKLIFSECQEISCNEDVNIVSRVVFLRKLCELNECRGSWSNAYEILSCLIHGSEIRRKIANDVYIDMPESDQSDGLSKIIEFIPDFDFHHLKNNSFTVDGIKVLYESECNEYFQLQLFRTLCGIIDPTKIKFSTFDDAWYKFIDETYHIENDYLHYLDKTKFNIVPSYITRMVGEIIANVN
jgi:energy-coupling factor transporter ATP-binding protein EcfA2